MEHRQLTIPILVSLALSGCAVEQVRNDIKANLTDGQSRVIQDPAVQSAKISRVTIDDQTVKLPVANVKPVNTVEASWLKGTFIDIDGRKGLSLRQVMEKFAANGVNFTSELPLDQYTFTGYIHHLDREAALRMVLGNIGLDYQADEARRLIVITPITSRTWYIPLGNRTASYASSGLSGTMSSLPSGQQTVSSSSNSSGATSSATATSSGSGSGSSSNQSSTGVTASDNFWVNLDKELSKRLKRLVPLGNQARSSAGGPVGQGYQGGVPLPPPVPGMSMPGMAQPMINAQQTDTSQVDAPTRTVGTFALNPDTGSVTVQAPSWVLDELDKYITQIKQQYDTTMTFRGLLISVTTSRNNSEGLDISSFASFARGRYGALIANSALGGVQVSFPAGSLIPSVSAGNGNAFNLGIQSDRDGLKIFNDYLQSLGQTSVKQRPVVTTTSGVAGEFNRISTIYYNQLQQSAQSGTTGSAATATTNTFVPIDVGTSLKINPRIDIQNGTVRAQISLKQTSQTGQQHIPQVITIGNSSQNIDTIVPTLSRMDISGEVLLKEGDLIIVGGQNEDNLQTNESGLPNTSDTPIAGGFIGQKNATRSQSTYYFALTVEVNKPKSQVVR
jgi:type II secretory pathway component GspD/PulD (secretin)